MGVRKLVNLFVGSVALVTLSGAMSVQAAPLNLVPGYPDLGGEVDVFYDYNTRSGGSGTLTIQGDGGPTSVFFYTDPNLGLELDPVFADFSIIGNFDGAGNFTGGTFQVDITGDSIPGVATAGDTLVTADLTNFGFAGSNGAAVLEFEYDITGGAWFDMGYGPWGGAIVSATLDSGIQIGAWDLDNFTSDWSAYGSGSSADAFVPVPAAVWLFASGLVGLVRFSSFRTKRG